MQVDKNEECDFKSMSTNCVLGTFSNEKPACHAKLYHRGTARLNTRMSYPGSQIHSVPIL